MTGLDLRPLSLGEILDRTFFVYRRHFLLFVGISAIPRVLTVAFGLLQVLVLQNPVLLDRGGKPRTVMVPVFGTPVTVIVSLLSAVVALIVYLIAQGGTIAAVSEIYLGRTTSIASSFRRVWPEIGSLFGVVFLNGLVTAAAFVCLIIPGIYVGCRLLVCVPAAIVEGRGPRESLSRSWELTKGFAGRAFVIFVIYFVIALSIGALLGGVLAFGIYSARDTPGAVRVWLALQQIASNAVDVLIVPILLIGTAIYYFDLRVRKEAFDLQFMMDPTSERSGGGGSLPSIL